LQQKACPGISGHLKYRSLCTSAITEDYPLKFYRRCFDVELMLVLISGCISGSPAAEPPLKMSWIAW
jgi:hypothetical protein